jgi:signal transduction histidine kinase
MVACNRSERSGFAQSHIELAELLAAQAGPLLVTARLQEQRRYHAGADERRRIAAELHDGLIQTLASIDLRIVTCREQCRAMHWAQLGDELSVLKRLAEEAIGEARNAVNELAPVRLRQEGVTAFLQEYVQSFRQRAPTPIAAVIALEGVQVPEPTALLLIGLLREGLNNVRKHAQARRVMLEIRDQGEHIVFRLADDGVGFRPEECLPRRAPTRHYGLAYLQERIAAAEGELRVDSHPGEGTTLEARVPLLTEERLVGLLARGPA